jgi:hypothetical protein
MGNIALLIIFLVFRAVIGQLFQSQKAQRPTNYGKGKKYRFPPIQDFMPKTTTIKESREVEIKPDILSIPVEKKPLYDIITQTRVKSDHELQPEPNYEIPELFTQEDILRGIILQEVLSPPKALMHRRH